MPDPDVELVRKAIALSRTTSGCCEWESESVVLRVRRELKGLFPPEGIKKLLQVWVLDQGGDIVKKRESREPWIERREFWYQVVIPVEEFPRGLFVEMELSIPDEDYPVVSLVNAHESGV